MQAIDIVGVASLIAVVGVVAGAWIQKHARFLYPYDVATLTIIILIILECIFDPLPMIDPFWYLPLGVGYLAGYLIVGRTSYTMIWETSLADKRASMSPWVMWHECGRTYVQDQTNKALLLRLLFNIRHEVISNIPLDSDWIVDAKYPLFPVFSRSTVVAESIETEYSREHLFWKFSCSTPTTFITIAYAGTVSKMQLAQDEEYLSRMQKQNTRLIGDLRELRSRQGPALMEMVLKMEQKVESTSPVNRMYDLISAGEERSKTKKKKKETVEKETQKKKEVEDEEESTTTPKP